MSSSVIDQVHAGIGVDPYAATIPVLSDTLEKADVAKRDLLIESAAKEVRGSAAARSERVRVSLVKVLVALLPRSLSVLNDLIARRNGASSYEVQFSIFCFLNEHPLVESDDRLRSQLLHSVGSYLGSIRSQSAQAAWMAGDLLGEHWCLSEAVPLLRTLAREARYVAGREGALHGLAHALERASKRQQWEIVGTLREISLVDRSAKVRSYASQIINGLRGM